MLEMGVGVPQIVSKVWWLRRPKDVLRNSWAGVYGEDLQKHLCFSSDRSIALIVGISKDIF